MRVAVAGLVLAMAAGCSSGGDDPPGTTLPSLTPPPTPTATVGAYPVRGLKQFTESPADAAEFVREFFAQIDIAYQAGRSIEAGAPVDPACASCRNFLGVTTKLAREGSRFNGPSFTNVTSESPPVEKGEAAVAFSADLPPRSKVDATGAIVKAYPNEGRLRMTVIVQYRSSGWVVRAMRVLK